MWCKSINGKNRRQRDDRCCWAKPESEKSRGEQAARSAQVCCNQEMQISKTNSASDVSDTQSQPRIAGSAAREGRKNMLLYSILSILIFRIL